MSLSERAERRLRRYEALLRAYSDRLGLLAPSDHARIWDRHIMDSLRGLACLGIGDEDVFDLGSGAGLPGVPVAVARPDVHVALVEPKAKRAAFLELVVQDLRLANAVVVPRAASEVAERCDACLVRAFGPPADTWKTASGLLKPRGRVIYYAGRSWSSDESSAILELGGNLSVCDAARFPWQGPVLVMTRSPSPEE